MQQHTNGLNNLNDLQPEDNKKHNATATSIQALADYTTSGKRETEKLKTLIAITENQPVTSRKLSELIEVERCHVTRCLKDLEQAGKVRVSHTAKCQVTNKRVQHYCLTDWNPSLFDNL